MAIRCPKCKRDYDVTLFAYGGAVRCFCGNTVILSHREQEQDALYAREQEENKISEIKRLADRICCQILSSDYRPNDIVVAKQKLRTRIEELFPDRVYLYGLIYEPRFRRLEEQFGDR